MNAPACRLLVVCGILCLAGLALADGLSDFWQLQTPRARAALLAAAEAPNAGPRALLAAALIRTRDGAAADAVRAWQAYIQAEPDGWATAAYWPAFVGLVEQTGQWGALEAAARAVLAANNAPLPVRADARLALADALERAVKATEADAARAKLGYLRQWRVIGPFDNISLSGFDKSYPPETEIDFAASYEGINRQPRRWHALRLVTREGICQVGDALGDAEESVFYAVTALNAPDTLPVLLHVNPTGASKLYLNGRLLFSDRLYREAWPRTADAFCVAATLQPGWNTVLVKLASDDRVTADFTLRLTTPAGEDLALAVNPERAVTPRQVEANPLPAPEPVIAARLRKLAPTPETLAALGYTLRLAGEHAGAAAALRQALAAAPASGWLHWELSQALSDDDLDDEARAERDLARQHAPGMLVEAELDALSDEEDALEPALFVGRAKALAASAPGSADAQWLLAYAYMNAEMTSDGLKAAQAAVKLAGGAEHLAMLAGWYLGEEKAAEADRVILEGLQADPTSETLLQTRASMLRDRGDTEKAIELYRRLVARQHHPRHRLALADLLIATHDDAQAEKVLRELRADCPQSARVCIKLAEVIEEQQRTPEALELYKAAVQLNPADVNLRSKVKIIAGEKPVIDLVPATPAEPVLAAAAKITRRPGVSAVVLLDEGRQVVYPDYATEMRLHFILKVLDEAAARAHQHLPLALPSSTARATVEQARIIKADGKVQDVTDDCGGQAAFFPSLARGDTIDLVYRVEDYPRGALTRQFWTDWTFTSAGMAVEQSRYVLISPPEMPLRLQAHGDIGTPAERTEQGWRIQEWRVSDPQPRAAEFASPGQRDRERWLDISTIPAWRDIARWYRDLSGPRCVPDEAVRARAAELTKGAATEEEKIRALVAFVSRDIQYQSTPFRMSAYVPTKPRDVLRDRYGDCKDKSALLVALLAAVNISADMALVNPRDRGLAPYLPSPRFTHAITRIRTAKGPLWVDATAEQIAFGSLPVADQGVPALVIDDATGELAQTAVLPPDTEISVLRYDLALNDQGKLSGSLEMLTHEGMAGTLRMLLGNVPEFQRDMVLRGITAQMLPGAVFDGGEIAHLLEQDKPLTLRVSFHADRYGANAGDFTVVRMPWKLGGKEFEMLFAEKARTQDIELADSYGRQRFALRLQVPAGYAPQDLPAKVEQTSPWGRFLVTYRLEGQTLVAEAEYAMTVPRVAATDFDGFAAFLRAFLQEEGRQLVFKRP